MTRRPGTEEPAQDRARHAPGPLLANAYIDSISDCTTMSAARALPASSGRRQTDAAAAAAGELPPDWQRALQRGSDGSPAAVRSLATVIVLAHLAAAWGLLQIDVVREAVRQAAPVFVDFVAPPATDPPPRHEPPPRPAPRTTPTPPAPAVIAAPPVAAPEPTPASVVTPPPEPAPPSPAAPAAAVAPASPAAPAPPAAPARLSVPATAVQYLTLPPVEVPRLSRRAGESGTVWLRVVVDVRGLPAQVNVQRSSGFARLDEQAVWAMRQARFRPHTRDGQPVELDVLAPIEYALE